MSTSLIVLLVVAVLVLFVVMTYNRLVSLRQITKSAFADIDVQLKQRFDLIPNLMETVKGYATHEREVFEKVTEARSKVLGAHSVAERGAAEGMLTGALSGLFAIAENYPELKANENFKQFQMELGDIENKIAAARRYLNNAVAEYNAAIQQFPAVLFAKNFGFQEAEMFNLNGEERAQVSVAPKVSF